MEANVQENDSATSLSEDEVIKNAEDDIDTSNNKVIFESSTCEEQSNERRRTENASSSCRDTTDDACKEPRFKKPLLLIGPKRGKIGKIRAVSHKVDPPPSSSEPSPSFEASSANKEATKITHSQNDETDKSVLESSTEGNVLPDVNNVPVPYLEPKWGGKSTEEYKLEVLKSGVILEKIDLTERSYHVVGRLPSCHLSLAHPTISRYHAIIQYRATADDKHSKGFYLYDLESTHGTFWNGHRIKPRSYVQLHGGHMIKFGCSQRKYIVQAPPEDQEEESELSVTELKEKRMEELRQREIKQLEEKEAEERAREAEENEGINWGMGEDADEDTDLTENPYASMADEELYLDDPKKTLRGWFEREGYDLQYQVEEKGIGQFLCWINLPKECFGGQSIKAEALVKGKKKESVVQCALEACRILDRHGLLRQANHESRRKKARNWEEEDYYDSDEDNFLDRTGTVERKREQRMKQAGKFEEKIETYNTLTEKYNEITNKISHLSNRLKEAQENSAKMEEFNEDSLDAFMSNLNTSTLSKSDVKKMKIEMQNLRKEEMKLVKLINLTKPADLPPLICQAPIEDEKDMSQQTSKFPAKKISQLEKRRKLFEARNKDSEKLSSALSSNNNINNAEEEEEEEEDENQEESNTGEKRKEDINFAHEKSASCEDEMEQNSMKIEEESSIAKSISQNTEISKLSTNVANDKKRKNKKLEKTKSLKKQYDQDVHSSDYSTWVPPQGQTGDGRTSLNEKYGY
ncbi:Kanadaptin [Ooceraea biroi]|uniref:Kanadaptin n=1 Tax=Ooceraea biroi TaxID=2015173 RepID=A0A026WVG6_OOCBI|nr:Kanadaptin [Ooceraea biroi]